MKYRLLDLPDELHFPEPLGTNFLFGPIGGKSSCEFAAYSLEGDCIWQWKSEIPYRMGVASGGETWLIGEKALVAFTPEWKKAREVEVLLEEHEAIGELACTQDSLLICLYRTQPDRKGTLTPRLVRTTLRGEVMWSTRLPVDRIAFEGCAHMGVVTNWESRPMPAWKPTTWLPYGRSSAPIVSANRLVASYSDMPRSGIGCRYVVNLDNGQLLWQSAPAPIGDAGKLSSGRFLLGIQGYGAFETNLYDEHADAMQKWNSHGYYVSIPEERMICIEMDNNTSKPQYVSELLPDGTVERRSPQLDGYYTSEPVCAPDGTIYFWRANKLWSWSDRDGLEERLEIGLGEGSYASSLHFSAKRIGLNIRGKWEEGGSKRIFAVVDLEE